MSSRLRLWIFPLLLLALGALVAVPRPISAQETGTITGQVTQQGNLSPLSGAQVYIPATDQGTLTNAQGRYLLANVPAGEVTLSVQLVGHGTTSRTVTLAPGETLVEDFQLEVEAVALEELVVTATGLQRAREIGNAIATVSADELVERLQPSTVETLLQSQAPGVAIRSNTGSIGTASDIKIRGAASISLSNRPLVYIDGARIAADAVDAGTSGQDYSRLNDLNPEDIASIEIVKGPAAATLYGTEAAGGVLRITTKQGSQGAAQYSFRMEYGANWDDTDYEPTFWNPRNFFDDAKDTVYVMRLLETDNPFRTGFEKTVSGSVRGGIEDLNYYVAGTWADRDGQTFRNKLERYNFRANLSMTPSDAVTVNVSNGINSTFTSLPDADNSGSGLIAQSYLGFPWVMPIEREDPNNPGSGVIRTCPQNFETARTTGQPLAELGFDGCSEKPGFGGRDQDDLRTLSNSNQTLRYTGSAEVVFQPVQAWTNRLTAGYDYFTDRWTEMTPVDPEEPFGDDSRGELNNRQVRSENLTLDGSSAYTFAVTDDLRTATTIGFQYFRAFNETVEATGNIFPAGSPAVNNSVLNQGTDETFESRTLGLFIQEQISWRDQVFITPAVRLDDNSAFGEELGRKAYPRVSASWVASDQAFVPDFFEVLKLRGAWGQSGKQPGPNDALGLLDPSPVIFESEEVLGVAPDRPGNSELKPETATELEFGFDMTSWEGRFNLDFTLYFQNTEDALVQRPLAPSSGFPGSRWENVGAIENRGMEIGIDVEPIRSSLLTWNSHLTFSTNDNEVTKLEDPILFGSQRHQEGFPFGAFFEKPVFINDAGEVEVQDEFVFMGESLPKWEGSLSQTFSFFDNRVVLFGNFAFAGGHKLLNFSEVFRCRWVGGGTYGGVCAGTHERNADGGFTDEARIKQRASLNNFSNAPWVEDADWLKLRTVSLQLAIPDQWVGLVGAGSANLRFITENVATWTEYSGLDPELSWDGGDEEARRDEFYTIPPARRFITSLSITF